MSDPNSPNSAAPPAAAPLKTPPATPTGLRIDVLQMLRDAQGDAEKTSLAQAELRGRLAQEEADELTANPILAKLQTILDTIRADVDAAAPLLSTLPEPYKTIVAQLVHWVDVGDDAFKALP